MTTIHSTAPTVLVAIDISKHRHEVLIGIPGKKRRRRMTITNTLEEFRRLSTVLASYGLPVRIGFEVEDFKKASRPSWQPSRRGSRRAPRSNSGGPTRPG